MKDNIENFHPYSPEYHDVARCGRGVLPKPNLNEELYNQLLLQHVDNKYEFPAFAVEYAYGVIDGANLNEFKKLIKAKPINKEEKEEVVFDFLESIFKACLKAYSTKQKLE